MLHHFLEIFYLKSNQATIAPFIDENILYNNRQKWGNIKRNRFVVIFQQGIPIF